MNSVILNLVPGGTGTAVGAGGLNLKESTQGADFFHALTALQSHPRGATAKSIQIDAANVTDDAKAQRAREASIAKMIDSGASQADILAALASELASSVATRLDATGSDAHVKLQKIFAAALAPPGDVGTASAPAADLARHLTQRFLRLQSVANAIAGQQTGQQNRIAGTFLDAHRAKDIPARMKIDQPAAAAVGVPLGAAPAPIATVTVGTSMAISNANGLTAAMQPPAANERSRDAVALLDSSAGGLAIAGKATASLTDVATAALPSGALVQIGDRTTGDGRTVKLGSRTAIGSGGDTSLGRVLARASLAADVRETPLAPVSDGDSATPPGDNAPPDAAVSAFVKAFESALNTSTAAPASEALPLDAQAATATAPSHRPAETAPAFVPSVAPFTIERAEISVAAPAGAPVSVPVDHSAIADQVLRGAFMRNTQGSSEMRLRLVPDSLGDVNVKLVITAGNVTAHVVAETPGVRDALVAAQPQLTKSLADAGLKLTNFTVDLSGGGFAGFSQQRNDSSHAGQQSGRPTESADTGDGPDETLLAAIPSFGPSIGGKPGAGDYNYLA